MSRAEHAYQMLFQAITQGSLKPGGRILEAELASRFGISRTPVREALRRLESEGLVCTAPRRGMIVAQLDLQAIVELYQMREVLEGTAARLAAEQCSDAEVYNLCELLDQERSEQHDPSEQASKNRTFHNAIYLAAHNRYLLKSLNSLRDAMALLGPTTYMLHGRPPIALSEHAAIVQAIENRDGAAAEEAAREHIRAAQKARIRLNNEVPDKGALAG